MRPLAWQAPSVDEGAAGALAAEMGLRPLTARILVGRGFVRADAAGKFLSPRLADLRPPTGMADLDRALSRLDEALARGETIGVFGDYDVDGVTTAAVLTTTLRALGGRVVARVASRHAGYGLGPDDVRRFAERDGCKVLVTGDLGTSDHESLALCRALGVDALVIDHHQVPSGPTAAYALINPHRADDAFPFKGLASCGVAFYLAAALRSRLGARSAGFDPRELLDLVALGTIADLVPLVDENRILVAAGLRTLGGRKRPGIAALTEIAERADGPITARDVGFRLTPRLNAPGRLGDAQPALDLLLAPDAATATRLAAEVEDTNRERQRIQELVAIEAHAAAAAQHEEGAQGLVVAAEGWHPGVLGIVAARLVDRFARPVVVVGMRDGEGRGSARTVRGFHLFEALSRCGQHLVKYGGHAGAAGLTVAASRLDDFRQAFAAEAARALGGAGLVAPALQVDALVELADLDVRFAEELARLAPFGIANAEPLFGLTGVTAQATRKVGQGHLQLSLAHGSSTGEAIAFGMADRDPGSGARLDLLATAELDTFRGERRARLKVKELFPRHN
jgi:single-stranded-DNA-specific exonuclease